LSNVINALVCIFFVKGRLDGAPTVASFFNAAILSRVWEWSGCGANTWLRIRLGLGMKFTKFKIVQVQIELILGSVRRTEHNVKKLLHINRKTFC